MKLRVHTFNKEIGFLELAKGASMDDVHEALRRHQLWVEDLESRPDKTAEVPTSHYHLPPPDPAPAPPKGGKQPALTTT